MTTTSGLRHAGTTRHALTVACTGVIAALIPALSQSLATLPSANGNVWALGDADLLPAGAVAQLAICDTAAACIEMGRRWPRVVRIVVVPEWDDGRATLAALDGGADVCVRGQDPQLIAAYVHSAARRHGLIERVAR